MRAMLRAATAAKILNGWNGPNYDQSYSVGPKDAPTKRWTKDRVMIYIHGLEIAGIGPLYRESEPVDAYDKTVEVG